MKRIALLIVMLLAATAAPARAQVDPQAEAERLFTEGNTHFDLAEYDEAIASFKEAYRYVEEPLFLYNIAQAYRQKKDCVNARAFYKSYLRKVPTGDFAKKAKKRVEEMEKCIKDGGGDPTIEPPDPTVKIEDPKVEDPKVEDPKVEDPKVEDPKVEDPRVDDPLHGGQPDPPIVETRIDNSHAKSARTKKLAGLAGIGVGVVLAATGGYFSSQVLAEDRNIENNCGDGCTADEVDASMRDGKAAERNAAILYAAGGVTVGVGVAIYVWGVLDGREAAPSAAQHVMIAPSAHGASVVGRWSF